MMTTKFRRVIAFLLMLVMLSGLMGPENLMMLAAYADDESVETTLPAEPDTSDEEAIQTESTAEEPAASQAPDPVDEVTPVASQTVDPVNEVQPAASQTETETNADPAVAFAPATASKETETADAEMTGVTTTEPVELEKDLELSISGLLPEGASVSFAETEYEFDETKGTLVFCAQMLVTDGAADVTPSGTYTAELKGEVIRRALDEGKTFGLIVNARSGEAKLLKAKDDAVSFRLTGFDLFVLFIREEEENSEPGELHTATVDTVTADGNNVSVSETDDAANSYVFPSATVKLGDMLSALGIELKENNYNVKTDSAALTLSSDRVNKNGLSDFTLTAADYFTAATLTLTSTNGKDEQTIRLSYAAPVEPTPDEPAEPISLSYTFADMDDYVMLLGLLRDSGLNTVAVDDAVVTGGDASCIELADYIGDYMVVPTAHFDRLVITVTTREGESYEIVFSFPLKTVEQTLRPALPGEAKMALSGLMPEGGSVEAEQVETALNGVDALAAYDINILTTDGRPWQPAEGESVTVQLYDPSFEGRLFVYHIADSGAVEYVGAAEAAGGWISFEATGFSIYAVAGAVSGTIRASDGNTYEITVTYDEAAGIPADARLSVVEQAADAAADAAVAARRAEGVNVALSHTFDIKILDANGGEIQPARGSTVTVTFALAEIANPNLTAGVYHLRESGSGITAESLTPSISGTVATVTTDGFSSYTVEFTYEGKQYVIPGGETLRLDEVLSNIGIVGTIEDAEVSNTALFEANWNKYDGNWYVYSNQEFHSDEWLKVTVDGVVYEIVVTDAYIGDNGGNDHNTFAKGADIATITIEDLSGFLSTGNFELTGGLEWNGQYFGWNGTLGVNEVKPLTGESAKITCKGAAMTEDNQLCDVIVTFSDIVLYGHDVGSSTGFHAVGRGGNALQVSAKTASSYGYGLKESINVKIVKTGTDTPVDGSFFFTVYDLNLNRTNQSATHIVGYNENNHYTETVVINSSSYDIYFINDGNGKLTHSGNMIYPSGNNGGGMSYMTGAAVRVENSAAGFNLTAYQYAPPGTETNFVLMPRAGINHTITSYSGYGGSIATSTTGAVADIVPGASTYKDGGKVDDQRTYVVPTGKTVSYKMTPESGYTLNAIYLDNVKVAELNGSGGLVITDQNKLDINNAAISKVGNDYICTFTNVSKTLKLSVSWKPTSSISLPVGHVGMDPSGGGVTLVDLTSNVSAEIAARTITLPYPSSPGAAPTPVKVGNTPAPTTITRGSTTYNFSFYGLAQQTFSANMPGYGASVDLYLQYTEYGQIQYSVDGTNWETWGDAASNLPRVYAMYGSTSGNYVYITVTPTLLGAIIDSNTEIEYSIIKHTDIWNYNINRSWFGSAANGQTITKTSNPPVYIALTDSGTVTTSATATTVKLKHGQSIIIPISYETDAGSFNTSPTIHENLVDSNISIEWLEVTETVPSQYDLQDIELENGGSGTKNVPSANYRVFTSGGTYYNNTAYGVPYRTPSAVLTNNGPYLIVYSSYSWTFGPATPVPTDTEVEFIHQRQTVNVAIQKILIDPSMSATDKKDFQFTVRAREWHPSHGEHFANLGNYVIKDVTVANDADHPATVMYKVNDDGSYGASVSSIEVPKGCDVLFIERWSAAEDLYDTTVTNTGSNQIKVYRAADREYMIEDIQADSVVTYTNTLKPRIVTVSKTVENGAGNEDFHFLVTLLDKNGAPVANYTMFTDDLRRERETNASGQLDLYLDDGRSVELKVPYGASLTITEDKAGEFNYESWVFTETPGLLDEFTTKVKVNDGAENNVPTVALTNVTDHYTTVHFTNTKIPLVAPTGVSSNTTPFGWILLFGALFAAWPMLGWLKRRRRKDDGPDPGDGGGEYLRSATDTPPPVGTDISRPPPGKAFPRARSLRPCGGEKSPAPNLASEIGRRAREKILSEVILTRIRGWPTARGDPKPIPRCRSGTRFRLLWEGG